MVSWLVASAGGCELTLHVQPGAARTELAGEHDGALKLRLHARAVEGAANAALTAFLAEQFGLPRREVKLLRGEKSRRKTVWIGVPPARALADLAAPDASRAA
jgi:hypothetical protein